MPTDRSDRPTRTVQFDTGMAMTLSCSPPRDSDAPPAKPSADGAPEAQQRGTAK